jgi:alkylation response protein AidB-like acyl-CoA dehydrogenase
LSASVEIVNEIAYGAAGVPFTLFISTLAISMRQLYGSDELKVKYLAPIAARGSFSATLASERTGAALESLSLSQIPPGMTRHPHTGLLPVGVVQPSGPSRSK